MQLRSSAIAKRFDAKDYFGGAPKVIMLKAIKEAVNAELTASQVRDLVDSTKAEIGKFALANVVKTGWLPKELRTPHYAGPGSEGYKPPAAAAQTEPSAPSTTATAVKKAKAARENKRNEVVMKRAAAAKKPAKKTSAKKR